MKINKKKFLISILTISTIAIASSAAIGITSVSQIQNDANDTLSDSIETYTSVPIAPPTMDEPLTPSLGGGNNGSGITTEYEIDWNTKKSPTGNVFFDDDFAYTNVNRTILLGVNPNTSKTEVNLPSTVKEIKGYTNVTNTKITKQVVGAFENIKNIVKVSIGGLDVKIHANAFKGCTGLESVIMQNNAIRSIGESAFENCTSLKSINLSSSLTTLEANVFKNTSSLEQIILPSNLRTIGEFAFENSSLTSLSMRNTKVSSIGNNAFKGTNKLTNIIFSNSISNIGISAFENSNINNVFITSSSLPNIGKSAFKDCKNLSEFKSSSRTSKLREIPESIFENCTKLSKIEFVKTSGLTSFKLIGKKAFKGTKISTLDIANIITIGSSAFEDCSLLTSLTGQNVLQTIEDSAFKNSSLEVITSVKSMQTKNGNTELSNIVTIGNNAFYGTKITKFKSGSNLTNIGNDSFKNISTLESVDFTLSTRLKKNESAFDKENLSKVKWANNRTFRGNKITH